MVGMEGGGFLVKGVFIALVQRCEQGAPCSAVNGPLFLLFCACTGPWGAVLPL